MRENSENQYKSECNSRPQNGCDNECSSEHDNECSSKCGSECKSDCPDKEKCNLEEFRCKTHELNDIKRTVAVLSGKGGVGKSLVTSLLAVMMRRKGYQVGILDADITGPSIPKVFGADDARADVSEFGIYPVRTHNDIKIMSINLLLEKSDTPVIWRGPLIAGAVKQFWTDVIWGKLDYLFLDMPPGTGDVPLTVFQSIPLDGIIIVTSPQDLVSLIVKKAYNMAKAMNIPVIGVIENMSYAICPECGKQMNVFGDSKAEQVALEMDIPFLGRLPIDSKLAALCDSGEIEKFDKKYIDKCIEILDKELGK
jgi:ATP-binding protein involved in chromosome partitioning